MNTQLICACGCGQAIEPKPHHKYHPPRYLPKHHQQTGQSHIYVPSPDEIPNGLCECGCGKATPIAKKTYRSKRHFRGHPIPRLPGHGPFKTGPESHKWKGGKCITQGGYIKVYSPSHPSADHDGYVSEHRLIMERTLGRYLQSGEVVHHINHNRSDNREENLMLMLHGQHSTLHAPERKYDSATMRRAGLKGAAGRWHKHK